MGIQVEDLIHSWLCAVIIWHPCLVNMAQKKEANVKRHLMGLIAGCNSSATESRLLVVVISRCSRWDE